MNSRFESMSGRVDVPFPAYEEPPAEPWELAVSWFEEALEGDDVREPRAMSLATTTAEHDLSARVIAVSGFDPEGVVFSTHRGSRKLSGVLNGVGLFYWKELGRQLSVAGPLEVLSDAESDRSWHARPVALHPMSSVSRQSEELDDAASLRRRAAALADRGPLPRPGSYCAVRLRPAAVEFWVARPDRVHLRLRYECGTGGWRSTRLQP